MGVWADALIDELDNLREWPSPEHSTALQAVSRGIALRDRDKATLRAMCGWSTGRRAEQVFIADPMPRRISAAFSSLVFGREPEFEAAVSKDQRRLDDLVKENNFRSELGRAARTNSSEGEVWWRIYVDPDVAMHPLLEWHSRTSVYPLWRGWRLLAVAFVSRLTDIDNYAYRHFEVHEYTPGEGGRVENVLYREQVSRVDAALEQGDSRKRSLGERVPLTSHPETENLMDEWAHGLNGMLAGRVANMIDTDPTIGISDYRDPEDFLLELSVAASIGRANLELTARRRAIVPESEVDAEAGAVDVGEQVYVEKGVDRDLGESTGGSGSRFKVLEYSFDAEALIAYKREVERTALNRVGIDAQYAGIDPAQGQADTGVALRIKLIPSIGAADERGAEWDQYLPRILSLMQQVDALPMELRGFARPWGDATEQPSVDRGNTLPEDRMEATDRRASAVAASIMSRRTAIEEDHPDWTPQQVDEELDRIAADDESSKPAFGATIVRTPPDEDGAPNLDADEADGEGDQ